MSAVITEPINDKERWEGIEPLSPSEVSEGFDRALAQVDANMEFFGERFPTPQTFGQHYQVMDNTEWTNGFWTGLLWLAYEHTGAERYRALADKNVDSFYARVLNKVEMDHHDLGFLYVPSCVAAYKLTGSEKARSAGVMAADQLMTRWQEKGRFLQAWGPMDSREHYRFIIDCMLNIPLLYWATDVTDDDRYADVAEKHFNTTCDNIIRPDGSAFHTFYMDPETGGPDHGATRQGFSDDSAWARGQAWGIYGIPLNMLHVGSLARTSLHEAMTNYFLNRLPIDSVCYWDLIFSDEDDQPRDSSAAAIAVCGLDEDLRLQGEGYENHDAYEGAKNAILRSLIDGYTSTEHDPGSPLLYHGVYSWHSGKGVDEGNIWGDYFFLEALVRASKKWNPYW